MNLGGASTTRWRDAYWYRPNISPSGEYPNDDLFQTASGVDDWTVEPGSIGVETYMIRTPGSESIHNRPTFFYGNPNWANSMTVRDLNYNGSEFPLILGPGKSPVQSMVEVYELEVYFPSGGTVMTGAGIGLWSALGPHLFGEYPSESGIDLYSDLNGAQLMVYHTPGLDIHGDPFDDITEDEWHKVQLLLDGYRRVRGWVDGEYQGESLLQGISETLGPNEHPPRIMTAPDNQMRDPITIPNFITYVTGTDAIGFEPRIRGLRVRAMDMNWPNWPQGES